MIDRAIRILQNQLQGYLARQPDLTVTDAIKLANVTKEDGTVAVPKESVGMTLINIEEERVNKAQARTTVTRDGATMVMNPEIRLNLYLLFSANFTDYLTSVSYISAIIGYFQGRNVFTPQNAPAMDPGLDRLIVDLYSLNLEQLNHLWGYLGGKYMPSVVYKVGLVRVQESIARGEGERVRHITISGRDTRP